MGKLLDMRGQRKKRARIFGGATRVITRAVLLFITFMTLLYGQDILENRPLGEVLGPAMRAVAGTGPVFNNGCLIKGNISYNSGKRVYHVPGQYFYNQTVISWTRGERWFCSEAEARAQGWQKARR